MTTPAHDPAEQTENPYRPPKETMEWPWMVGIFVAALVIAGVFAAQNTGGGKSGSTGTLPVVSTRNSATPNYPISTTTTAEPAVAVTRHVKYAITGGKHGSVTYNADGQASIEQDTDAKLPWTKEFDWPVDSASQTAQVTGKNNGSGQITCMITVDGTVVKTVTSKGTASCEAPLS